MNETLSPVRAAGAAIPNVLPPAWSGPIGQAFGTRLDADAVARVLAHQRESGLRFGEAAVALGLLQPAEVEQALARQFRYPVARAPAPGEPAPLAAELVVAHRPYAPAAEALRGLRAQVRRRLAELDRRVLAVLSPAHGDGRSHVAANLAVAFAQGGGRTLLIDADLRRPRLHTLFGPADPAPAAGGATMEEAAGGLAQMLSGRSGSLAVDAVPGLPALWVLRAGAVPPNPLELLEGPGLARLLADVTLKFEHVVVDTPAFEAGMDAAVIAAACGAGLMVLRPGSSRLAAAQDLMASVPRETEAFAWVGVVFDPAR
jgi:chain length determinant protein tyrosine kinase EpsG